MKAPVDRVMLQIPIERRLAATLRAAVLTEAKSCGLSLAQAAPLAKAVTQRFRRTAEDSRDGAPRILSVVFEQAPDELRIHFKAARGRRASTFRVRRRPPRPLRKDARHPSV